MAAPQTPPSVLRVLDFIGACEGIEAGYADERLTFTIAAAPPQIVSWDVDPAELAAAAVRMNRPARAAFGRSGAGWNLLLVHLEATLRTFTEGRGRLELTEHGQFRVIADPR